MKDKIKEKTNNTAKNNKSKEKISNIKIDKKKIGIILIVFLVTIYIIYKVANLIRNPSETFFVEKGKRKNRQNPKRAVVILLILTERVYISGRVVV